MFKPGDTVRCIDARRSGGLLRAGAFYRVDAIRGRFIAVEGCDVPFPGWHPFRFRAAPSIAGLRALLELKPAGVPA